jgi:hypothetical protein
MELLPTPLRRLVHVSLSITPPAVFIKPSLQVKELLTVKLKLLEPLRVPPSKVNPATMALSSSETV